MDVFFKFLISASAGGLIGGFGNAVLGEGLSGITRDSVSGKLDLGSWKNLTIGVLSGVAWLAPNADRWTNVSHSDIFVPGDDRHTNAGCGACRVGVADCLR